MTREEHVAWCKKRALEYLDRGEVLEAVASMGSDLSKHPETRCSLLLLQLGMKTAIDQDATAARRWIEGFR